MPKLGASLSVPAVLLDLACTLAGLVGLTQAACAGGGLAGDDDDDGAVDRPGPDSGGVDPPDASVPSTGDWLVLSRAEWTLAPGEEAYVCVVTTLAEDLDIGAFAGMSPPGTHHTVLTLYTGLEPDGVFPCNGFTNGQNMIYGTGVGTPPSALPPGVAVRLKKGQRVIDNIHLFNTGDEPLHGTSGTLYKRFQGTPVHLAEIILAGPTIFLAIPPGTSTQVGHCSISSITKGAPLHLFSVAPHMHQLGTRMRTVHIRNGKETVIQDVAYDFDNQVFTAVDPAVELRPGDRLRTECTYVNPTGRTVTFGESSTDEMCFTSFMYYPAQGAPFVCSDLF